MLATVKFLEQTQLASGSVIYDGMALKELAENTYSELLTFAASIKGENVVEVPLKLKEKLGTMMSTKEMNPALFISDLFLFGIYMPVFAPFLTPLFLTVTGIIKLKVAQLRGKAGSDGKVKTE